MKKSYFWGIIGTTILSALIILLATSSKTDNVLGGLPANAVDLIGTRVGTTTTGVAFTSTSSVTTYRKFIGGGVDEVTLNIKATAASTATVDMKVLASNDSQCDTSTTSPSQVAIADINWYDIGYNLKDLAGSATLAGATTTITWTPTAANQGRQLVFTNLNANCLRFDIAATSTTLYAQIRTKQNK